jgi:hypothetical protein
MACLAGCLWSVPTHLGCPFSRLRSRVLTISSSSSLAAVAARRSSAATCSSERSHSTGSRADGQGLSSCMCPHRSRPSLHFLLCTPACHSVVRFARSCPPSIRGSRHSLRPAGGLRRRALARPASAYLYSVMQMLPALSHAVPLGNVHSAGTVVSMFRS